VSVGVRVSRTSFAPSNAYLCTYGRCIYTPAAKKINPAAFPPPSPNAIGLLANHEISSAWSSTEREVAARVTSACVAAAPLFARQYKTGFTVNGEPGSANNAFVVAYKGETDVPIAWRMMIVRRPRGGPALRRGSNATEKPRCVQLDYALAIRIA